MTEAEIQSAIHRAIGSRPDCRLFRNHTGRAQDNRGRWHTFGLAVGSADLIGWCRGKFLSIEVKTETGKVKPEQQRWMDAVNEHGGIAFVACSVQEAETKLNERLI